LKHLNGARAKVIIKVYIDNKPEVYMYIPQSNSFGIVISAKTLGFFFLKKNNTNIEMNSMMARITNGKATPIVWTVQKSSDTEQEENIMSRLKFCSIKVRSKFKSYILLKW
jgi:hypothetical protein